MFLLALLASLVVSGPAPYQAWADAAKTPTPNVTVEVEVSDACGNPCIASTNPPHIYLPPNSSRADFFHEVGHVVDWRVLDDSDRWTLRTTLKWPVWYSRHRSVPGSSELFPELYALCAIGPTRTLRNTAGWQEPLTKRQARWGCRYTARQVVHFNRTLQP